MFSADCRQLNSSFSYTTDLLNPYEFNGFPRSENTACVRTSRLLVMDPDADRPSVMKIQLSRRKSSSASFADFTGFGSFR